MKVMSTNQICDIYVKYFDCYVLYILIVIYLDP